MPRRSILSQSFLKMSGWPNLAEFIGSRQTWPRSKILNQNICLVHLNSSVVQISFCQWSYRWINSFSTVRQNPYFVDLLIRWQQKCKLFHSFIFPRALEMNVEMWVKRRLLLKVPYLFFFENLIRIVSKGNILRVLFSL